VEADRDHLRLQARLQELRLVLIEDVDHLLRDHVVRERAVVRDLDERARCRREHVRLGERRRVGPHLGEPREERERAELRLQERDRHLGVLVLQALGGDGIAHRRLCDPAAAAEALRAAEAVRLERVEAELHDVPQLRARVEADRHLVPAVVEALARTGIDGRAPERGRTAEGDVGGLEEALPAVDVEALLVARAKHAVDARGHVGRVRERLLVVARVEEVDDLDLREARAQRLHRVQVLLEEIAALPVDGDHQLELRLAPQLVLRALTGIAARRARLAVDAQREERGERKKRSDRAEATEHRAPVRTTCAREHPGRDQRFPRGSRPHRTYRCRLWIEPDPCTNARLGEIR